MSKKVVIDAYRGGDDIGNTNNDIIEKDFNLKVSKYIKNRLDTLGIPNALTREDDSTIDIESRVSKIKSLYGTGTDVIVISNALKSGDEGSEIVYALRNGSTLSRTIAEELEKTGQEVNKYYQRRLPSDTSKDYNQLIRETANNESLIIYYGNVDNQDDAYNLVNNWEDLAEAVVIALTEYLNIPYDKLTDGNYYVVKSGDTLYSIARKYNTTVDEIKKLNNLTTNTLKIGSVLKIPTTSTNNIIEEDNYITYTIQKGDTLYSIANKYNTTVDNIKSLNNLTSNTLTIGNNLKIPSTTEEIPEDYITYKVVSGDNLYSIANKYNTTVNTLKSLNNLTSNLLSIGQILKIPTSTTTTTPTNYTTYKVVSGDSLYSIANKYNTTVDAIKNLNNLTSNLLSIGQTLKIPTSTETTPQYTTYKVVSGDSLYSIAKRYNTTVNAIKSLNNLTSNLLNIGQILKIPSA